MYFSNFRRFLSITGGPATTRTVLRATDPMQDRQSCCYAMDRTCRWPWEPNRRTDRPLDPHEPDLRLFGNYRRSPVIPEVFEGAGFTAKQFSQNHTVFSQTCMDIKKRNLEWFVMRQHYVLAPGAQSGITTSGNYRRSPEIHIQHLFCRKRTAADW